MTAYKARSFTLKSGTGGGATLITQCQELSFAINNETVDVTNKDSGGWRTLLEDAGTKSVQIQAGGVVDNTASYEAFQDNAQAATLNSYRLEYADSDVLEGSFQITNYQVTGGTSGAQQFSATLESSGQVTFTDA